MKKKIVMLLMTVMVGSTVLAGCGGGNNGSSDTAESTDSSSAAGTTEGTAEKDSESTGGASGPITICSREDGSGTRGAFVELFGIEEEVDGEKVDMTTPEAKITNSTSVMMTTVEGDVNAIGYISLGSLNDTVTAVKIDGAEATPENIENGTYKVVRPFNIATKADLSEAAQDFVDYIMSEEGQAVVEENGYIPISDVEAFSGGTASGDVVVAGSSSVTPVMEKLKEAYAEVNPNVNIEVQQSDSTTGMQSAIDGLCDIGMASRELKDSETEAGLTATVIAQDGIAVIVNNDSGIDELSSDQVKSIYTGEVLDWEDVK
ncbi:MAG: substrate-binding domain-containing protein [Ruminococcus sp.]|jgi:phosphate transport system substrate-binding protein